MAPPPPQQQQQQAVTQTTCHAAILLGGSLGSLWQNVNSVTKAAVWPQTVTTCYFVICQATKEVEWLKCRPDAKAKSLLNCCIGSLFGADRNIFRPQQNLRKKVFPFFCASPGILHPEQNGKLPPSLACTCWIFWILTCRDLLEKHKLWVSQTVDKSSEQTNKLPLVVIAKQSQKTNLHNNHRDMKSVKLKIKTIPVTPVSVIKMKQSVINKIHCSQIWYTVNCLVGFLVRNSIFPS